jgi:hypothetical protein
MLVVRTGNNFIKRRTGWVYFKNEITLQFKLYDLKLFGIYILIRNLFCRTPIRIFPNFIVKIIYKLIKNYKCI